LHKVQIKLKNAEDKGKDPAYIIRNQGLLLLTNDIMSKTTKRLSLQQSSTDSIQNDIELIGYCLGIIAWADEVEAVEGGITRLLVNFLGILNLTTVNGEPDSGLLKVANDGY
jgi:hypothetical protein